MMKNIGLNMLLCLLLIPLIWQNAQAQSLVRTADLANLALGERVELEGRFLSRINYETLLFEDEAGQVEVIISDGDSLPAQLLSSVYQVVVRGEVGSGYHQTPVLLFDAVKVVAHDPERVGVDALPMTQGSYPPKQDVAVGERTKLNDCNQDRDMIDSVSAVLAGNCIGRRVSLVGFFVSQVNYEILLFRDNTGEIEIVFTDEDMKLVPRDAWSIPVNLQGEVVRGYQGSALVLFERVKNPPADL